LNAYSNVRPGGYAWWYFDAVSDDGARALTAIFFIGSVFSPDYAARVRRGEVARAEDHLGINLALYERGKKRAWVMSEHGAAALGGVGDGGPRIADSAIEADNRGGGGGESGLQPLPFGPRLRVTVHERTAPFFVTLAGVGARVDGTIDLEPLGPALDPVELARDGDVRHRWHVIMPSARVRVRFARPDFSFDGVGYHDINAGDGRLEDAFQSWSWARFHDDARTTIVYATHERSGAARAFVVDVRDGQPAAARTATLLPEGERRVAPWGLSMPRWFAVDDGGRTLRCTPTRLYEAAPFYARYAARLGGDVSPVIANGVGEYLDLDRFRDRGVQFLLRFKMRRT
jgi:carotenoid 1,2-hydratase